MSLDVWTYTLLLWMCACASTVVSQDVEGCPSYGCTPTGSFSLLTSKGIPRTGVKVIWTTQLSNSSGTGSPLLGCVSNNKHVVCPTPQGYVGLDGDTGRVLWRDNILDNPTLPIMDVMGDVIGSDGKYLTKIEADGTVMKPFIPLDPPMNPLYSVEFGDENILLLVSQTGELVAYLTNGIPMANLFLRGNVENYNGTFHPIAQPVMNGSRAYILTEFKPNPEYTDIPRDKTGIPVLYRLFAVDIRTSISQRMRVAWTVSFTKSATGCGNNVTDVGGDSKTLYEHVLLAYKGAVYISFTGQCKHQNNVCNSEQLFIAVIDLGNHGNVLYKQPRAPSYLAAYDDGLGRCHDVAGAAVVWLAEQGGSIIFELDPQTGMTIRVLNIVAILDVSYVIISSRLMVKRTDHEDMYILIVGTKQSSSRMVYKSHVTAFQVSSNVYEPAKVLWNVGLQNDLYTEGQLSLVGDTEVVIVAMGYNSTGMYAMGVK